MDWSEIGNKIKLHRISSGLTQDEYAEPIGVKQQTLGRWESGQKISEKYWGEIMKSTGLDIESMLHSKNSNFRVSGAAQNVHQGEGDIVSGGSLSPAISHLVDLLIKHDKEGSFTNRFVMEIIQSLSSKNG